MALKGNLSDFGMSDIFQLVGQQVKTGILSLARDNKRSCEIHFIEGKVVHAKLSKVDDNKYFGKRMIAADLISEVELEDALQEQKRSSLRLGPILIQKGYVSKDMLKEMVRLQVMETLLEIFQWESGKYEFIQTDDFDFDHHSQVPIPAEEILLEVFRIVDEWPSVREVIPSFSYTCKTVKNLPKYEERFEESTQEDFLDGMAEAISGIGPADSEKPSRKSDLSEHDRRVYLLIKPDRRIQRLIELSRLSEFETCKALCHLQANGYIAIVEPAEGLEGLNGGRFSFLKSALRALPAAVTRILMWALVGFLCSAFFSAVIDLPMFSVAQKQVFFPSSFAFSQIQQNDHVQKLSESIEIYRLLEGTYPSSLQDLVSSSLLDERALYGPFEELAYYQRTDKGFLILPPLR